MPTGGVVATLPREPPLMLSNWFYRGVVSGDCRERGEVNGGQRKLDR